MRHLLKRGLVASFAVVVTSTALFAQDYNVHVDGTVDTLDSFFLTWDSANQTFDAVNTGPYNLGGADFPFSGPLVSGDPYAFVAAFGEDHVVVSFNNDYITNVVGHQFEEVLLVSQADFRASILDHNTAFFTATMAKFFQDHSDGLPFVTGPGFLINFSGGGPGGTMSVDPVPEPTSVTVLGLAVLILRRRRSR